MTVSAGMNWDASGMICCGAPEQLADHGVRDVVFAIGTFDGLHRGHVAVIESMLDLSRELDALPAVLTFRPHPRAVLSPANPPPLLGGERLALGCTVQGVLSDRLP